MNTPEAAPAVPSAPASVHSASASIAYAAVALVTIVVPMLGAATGVWLLSREGISAIDLALLLGLYLFTILGVELGYHRYLTHRTMKTRRWLKRVLIIGGVMAADGPPLWWAAIHRRHHAHGDHAGDPHSPNEYGHGLRAELAGWWHAHIAWMFKPAYTAAHTAFYAKDLLRDPDLLTIDRFYVWWVALGLGLPAAVGGLVGGSWHAAWTGFIWGGLTRMCLGQHALWWGIITLCHTIGTRPFNTPDSSRNNVLVAVMFLGDGWHNNHHAFPGSAKVGFRWWEFDPTWWVVVLFRRLGWVGDVTVPSRETIDARRGADRLPATGSDSASQLVM